MSTYSETNDVPVVEMKVKQYFKDYGPHTGKDLPEDFQNLEQWILTLSDAEQAEYKLLEDENNARTQYLNANNIVNYTNDGIIYKDVEYASSKNENNPKFYEYWLRYQRSIKYTQVKETIYIHADGHVETVVEDLVF